MSNYRATPKITRSWNSYLTASLFAAVALNMAFLPLGVAAVNASAARPVATTEASTTTLRAANGAAAAAGADHRAIAADAVSVGDAHTVEMSIAAYERAPELSLPQ